VPLVATEKPHGDNFFRNHIWYALIIHFLDEVGNRNCLKNSADFALVVLYMPQSSPGSPFFRDVVNPGPAFPAGRKSYEPSGLDLKSTMIGRTLSVWILSMDGKTVV
jgi:hypothetical protein